MQWYTTFSLAAWLDQSVFQCSAGWGVTFPVLEGYFRLKHDELKNSLLTVYFRNSTEPARWVAGVVNFKNDCVAWKVKKKRREWLFQVEFLYVLLYFHLLFWPKYHRKAIIQWRLAWRPESCFCTFTATEMKKKKKKKSRILIPDSLILPVADPSFKLTSSYFSPHGPSPSFLEDERYLLLLLFSQPQTHTHTVWSVTSRCRFLIWITLLGTQKDFVQPDVALFTVHKSCS